MLPSSCHPTPCHLTFSFYKSRDLKKLARSILNGVSTLFEVAALIVLFLILFSFAAYYLFFESGIVGQNNSNFASFQESVYSLLVLQTTANFPDVMMASYAESQWTALYFFIYNVLGIYFLMALVLAVIYNNYSDHILRDVERIKIVRDRAITATFKMLTLHQHPDTVRGEKYGDQIRLRSVKRQRMKKVVYYSTFRAIMGRMRRDSSRWSGMNYEEQIKWMYLAMAGAKHKDYDDGIDQQQFLEIVTFIELQITKDVAKENRIAVLKKTAELQSM